MARLSQHAGIAGLASLAFAAITFTYGVMRCINFHCTLVDLGSFYQVVDAFFRGVAPITALQPPHLPTHWFGIHFSPILALAVPFYWLWPSPLVLQLLQSCLVASTSIPIFLACRKLKLPTDAALLMVGIFLLNPFVISGTVWDFHEVAFAVPAFGWLMLAIISKRFGLFLLSCAALLATKEHYGVAVAGAGVLWVYQHKQWLKGLSVATAGLFAAILIIGVIMPNFAGGGVAAALDNASLGGSRYGWLHQSLTDPSLFLSVIHANAPQWLVYIALLFLPVIFLPFGAILWLLPMTADLAANILSSASLPRTLLGYHSMPMVPVIIIAAARVIAQQHLSQHKALYLAPILLWAGYMAHPHGPAYWQPSRTALSLSTPHRAALSDIRQLILAHPAARVEVQNNIGIWLNIPTQRLHAFPSSRPVSATKADIIVAYLDYPFHQHPDIIDRVYNIPALGYLPALDSLLAGGLYQPVFYRDKYLVLMRPSASIPSINLAPIRADIAALSARINALSPSQNPPAKPAL